MMEQSQEEEKQESHWDDHLAEMGEVADQLFSKQLRMKTHSSHIGIKQISKPNRENREGREINMVPMQKTLYLLCLFEHLSEINRLMKFFIHLCKTKKNGPLSWGENEA